jgi:hypothetical protein
MTNLATFALAHGTRVEHEAGSINLSFTTPSYHYMRNSEMLLYVYAIVVTPDS